MTSTSGTRGPSLGSALGLVGLAIGSLSLTVVVAFPTQAGAATPSVSISPSAASYASGQTVKVSVGPNSLFVPNSRIVIVECADPGGTSANLPTSLSGCDENTVESDTVLVQPNGSFTENSYVMYSLPNAALGEKTGWLPVCNQTSQCVLFVGEDQDDFSRPKVFSQPFALAPGASSNPVAAQAGTTPATSDPAPASASASVSLPPATLAFTGMPEDAQWLAAAGVGLAAIGALARRTVRRRRS